jgi:hypothetical protein
MLFKAYPGSDVLKVIWMIPARELWGQYAKNLLTANKTVSDSIHDFQFNRNKLEEREDDDMTDERVDAVYKELSSHAKRTKNMSKVSEREIPPRIP